MKTDTSPHLVHDYDVTFPNGNLLAITVDDVAGDTAEISRTRLVFHLRERPSLTDETSLTPGEDITVYLGPGFCVQHRVRLVEEATSEEREQWRKTLQELAGNNQQVH